jgi:hypothetical protein
VVDRIAASVLSCIGDGYISSFPPVTTVNTRLDGIGAAPARLERQRRIR